MNSLSRQEVFELSNGIPVVLQPCEGLVASFYWWVKVGSADEKKGQEGFAHYLEHMLFKDTTAVESGAPSTGKMARSIEALGGDINAYTSLDQTVFHVTCAEKHFEKVIRHFSDLSKPQRFLKTDFLREKEVILEELKRSLDSPGRQLFQSLFQMTYRKHPYGRPVIGFKNILEKATVKQLEAFYKAHYVSENMGIIVAAPFDDVRKKKLKTLLENLYGKKVIPKKAYFTNQRIVENPIKQSSSWKAEPFDVKTTTLALSFRAPNLLHEDLPALDLLCSILGEGEVCRLYRKLFYEKSIVTDISSGMYAPKDSGMIYFQAEFDQTNKTEEVLQLIIDEIERIKNEPPTEEELKRVIVNSESEKYYSTQTVDGLASRMGFLYFNVDDPHFDEKYLEACRNITPAQISEVARKYLDPRRLSGAILYPKSEPKFDVQSLKKYAESKITQNVKIKSAKKEIKENPIFNKTKNGTKYVHHHRPFSKVFSLQVYAPGGTRLEYLSPVRSSDQDWGASYLLGLTWAKGTETKSSSDISHIIESHAADLDGMSGKNTIGLELTGLKKDWKTLSSLFHEVLTRPSFEASEVNHSKRVVLDMIKGSEDSSSQICNRLFLKTLYEDHPYSRQVYGTEETVPGIDTAVLKQFHQNWVRPSELVVSYSGPHEEAVLLELVEQIEHDLNQSAPLESNMTLASPSQLIAPRWVHRHLDREQLHIMKGGFGISINSD